LAQNTTAVGEVRTDVRLSLSEVKGTMKDVRDTWQTIKGAPQAKVCSCLAVDFEGIVSFDRDPH
jgi:hypothetical protein